MSPRSRLAWIAILLSCGLTAGCTQGPDGNPTLQPLVFPWEGQLGAGAAAGSTVAIVIDSNYIEGADASELYDLHRARVSVVVVDPLGVFPNAAATVRSVFSLGATANSRRHTLNPGSFATVVVADLPGAQAIGNPSAFPFTALLRVQIDGQTSFEPRFVVTGKTGIRNPVIDAAFRNAVQANFELEPRPMLRLRPKRRVGIFQQGQPAYGGMEFTIAYLDACIQSVELVPATEAANATAVVSPVQGSAFGYSLVKAVLVDPKGFNLRFITAASSDQTLAGEGPLLDIAVNWKTTTNAVCDLLNPDLITIGDLTVSDVDGDAIFSAPGTLQLDTPDAPATNAVFRRYPVDLPPPAPSGC